ncbi:MAG: hypothetical protein PHV23_03135 [Candidatus Gracilibacteria bacterium]|nr:hypothetical protein [Candidatus Gracilibacteria bacterium]
MSSFSDLVNIEEFDKRDNFKQDRGEVAFFCKDCRKIVETNRIDPNGYKFTCNICSGTNIVIGTHEGLKTNYKIKEN